MATQSDARELIGRHVVGPDGQELGTVDEVYLDNRTHDPEFVAVKGGLFGKRASLVPLQDSRIAGDQVRVPYDKEKVKGAPNVNVGREMTAQQERELFGYYGVRKSDVPGQTGRSQATDQQGTSGTATDEQGMAGTDAGMAAGAGTGMAAGAGTGMAAGSETETAEAGTGTDTTEDTASGRTADELSATSRTGAPTGGRHAVEGEAWTDQPRMRTEQPDEVTLIRSEEQMRVGTERRESGRVRISKHIETEPIERRISVSHEDIEVKREPVTDAEHISGEDISEDEQEIILHEEHPVVSTENVPVERVHVTRTEREEEQTVRAEVRKEKIDIERDDESRA